MSAIEPITLAQKSWEKPATYWTEADARRILSDSPWARKTTARCGNTSSTHNRAVLVRWEHSQPIRQALHRIGTSSAAEDMGDYAAVAVLIPAEASAACGLQGWETSTKVGVLRVPLEKDPVSAVRVKILKENDKVPLIVVFLFPRSAEIGQPRVFRLPLGVVLHSRQIVFEARIGQIEIRQSFPLQDMYYLGRFEL